MKDCLTGREILLGVTGGIAAFKSAQLCSHLVQAGAGVTVVMTRAAENFIGRATFAGLTGREVRVGSFDVCEFPQGEHIGLAQRAELAIVAPATAAAISRIASGLADDLLTTTLLVCRCPVLVAPAMNCEMWAAASVQRNMSLLRSDGCHVVGPGKGWLSCGQVGAGRMAEPDEIFQRAVQLCTADQRSGDQGDRECEF
jgi:phosphopantothenoylcysteine decarboxylase/phosphopantothenate--cysteine ligase